MKQVLLSLFCACAFFAGCKKESATTNIVGQWLWTIQYANNPAYNSTPQSTGVIEVFQFTANGTYALLQNNSTVNTGTYKIASATSTRGDKVASVLFTNLRVTDSVAYFSLNNDSLFFSNDLIGSVGSGSRHYGKQ